MPLLDTQETNVPTRSGGGFQEGPFAGWKDKRAEILRIASALDAGTDRQRSVARAMRDCCGLVGYLVCPQGHGGKVGWATYCKRRFCPICERRAALLRAHALYDRVSILLAAHPEWSLYLVSLTRRNVPEAASMVDLILRPWRLLRKSRDWKTRPWGRVPAAFWGFEFTEQGRGWHPHLHALVVGPPGVTDGLLEQWCAQVGPDAQMEGQNAKEAENGLGAVLEVSKYLAKSHDLTEQQLREGEDALVGRHVHGTFGALRGLVVPKEECQDPACEVCGAAMAEEVWRLQGESVGYGRFMVDSVTVEV